MGSLTGLVMPESESGFSRVEVRSYVWFGETRYKAYAMDDADANVLNTTAHYKTEAEAWHAIERGRHILNGDYEYRAEQSSKVRRKRFGIF